MGLFGLGVPKDIKDLGKDICEPLKVEYIEGHPNIKYQGPMTLHVCQNGFYFIDASKKHYGIVKWIDFKDATPSKTSDRRTIISTKDYKIYLLGIEERVCEILTKKMAS
ncbi:hypothetical protein ACAG39_00170 [Caldicellulosiruptoraceae bacterium PP1]